MKWRIHMTLVIHNQQIIDDENHYKSIGCYIEDMKEKIINYVKYGNSEEIKKNITFHQFPWEEY